MLNPSDCSQKLYKVMECVVTGKSWSMSSDITRNCSSGPLQLRLALQVSTWKEKLWLLLSHLKMAQGERSPRCWSSIDGCPSYTARKRHIKRHERVNQELITATPLVRWLSWGDSQRLKLSPKEGFRRGECPHNVTSHTSLPLHSKVLWTSPKQFLYSHTDLGKSLRCCSVRYCNKTKQVSPPENIGLLLSSVAKKNWPLREVWQFRVALYQQFSCSCIGKQKGTPSSHHIYEEDPGGWAPYYKCSHDFSEISLLCISINLALALVSNGFPLVSSPFSLHSSNAR